MLKEEHQTLNWWCYSLHLSWTRKRCLVNQEMHLNGDRHWAKIAHVEHSSGTIAGALRTWHNPRPSAFTVRLSHGLGMQLRMGQQAADNLSSGSVRRTGVIVAKRRSVRFMCSTSKGPGVRHAIHR